jgi:hypothetical protein
MDNENPISRAIVDSYVCNKFEHYLPIIAKVERGGIISACLPDEYYQKWYPHIVSNDKLNNRIKFWPSSI